MMRKKPPRKKFTFCYVFFLAQCVLIGSLTSQINLINALACCENYWKPCERIIDGHSGDVRTRLSDLVAGRHRAPDEWQEFFASGHYRNKEYRIPTAQRFKKVLNGRLMYNSPDGALWFRDMIRDCLEHGETDHLSPKVVEQLVLSVHKDDDETLFFKSFYYAILCKENNDTFVTSKSKNNRIYDKAKWNTQNNTDSENILLQDLDTESDNSNN